MVCSPSYTDYKPKMNAVILLGTGHTKGRTHRKGRAREGNQKPEGGECAHCIEINIVILNWPRPPRNGD
jgi:hypothetical protein